MKRVTVLLFAAFCFLVTSPAWAQGICYGIAGNLVVNCGFETGDFTGWTQDGNTGFTGVDGNPNSGSFAAFMGPVGSDGSLEQLVGDNSTTYQIMFWLYSDGGSPNDFTLFWNGVDVGPDLVDVGGFGYTKFTFNVAGNFGAGSNLLEFVFRQDPAYWYLDDVSVVNTGTPEPSSLILMGSGILGLAGVIRRKLAA